jgi:chromosome segregation ATPase
MPSGEKKKKRMRMTMPKKQEDLEKVVEEVMEIHPEMAHEHEHEHMHVHGLEDVLSAVEVIIDSFNTRLRGLEKRVEDLASEVATLYMLNAKLFEVILSSNSERRKQALREAISILEKHEGKPVEAQTH